MESFNYLINLVFLILCNVCVLYFDEDLNMIVCWGGYLINEIEYLYVCKVGNQLGLCELNICIGCGLGVMEVLMKGVVVGYV